MFRCRSKEKRMYDTAGCAVDPGVHRIRCELYDPDQLEHCHCSDGETENRVGGKFVDV